MVNCFTDPVSRLSKSLQICSSIIAITTASPFYIPEKPFIGLCRPESLS